MGPQFAAGRQAGVSVDDGDGSGVGLGEGVPRFPPGPEDPDGPGVGLGVGLGQYGFMFRLFGSKLELFLLVIARCFSRMREEFLEAAGDLQGLEAIAAMGRRYDQILSDRTFLLIQLQSFAACHDPVVREVVRTEFGLTWQTVAERCGLEPVEIKRFMATGMLLNVAAAMDLGNLDTPWAQACANPVAGETALG